MTRRRSRSEASRWRSSAISFERRPSCDARRAPSVRRRPWPARGASSPREIALASRDLGWPAKTLDAARATLEAHGDRVNAAHARHLEVRRLLLIGRLDEAERMLAGLDPAPLLLIFYLMLDRQDIPLVIDQPEDNLDNKSVYEILVTFIKQAKKRRQIILVTHNPNLAVVADAEQIIHVSIDKKDSKHDFDFFAGAIEEPRINQAVVDILEGTLPAFDNRRLKYRKQDRRVSTTQ